MVHVYVSKNIQRGTDMALYHDLKQGDYSDKMYVHVYTYM